MAAGAAAAATVVAVAAGSVVGAAAGGAAGGGGGVSSVGGVAGMTGKVRLYSSSTTCQRGDASSGESSSVKISDK